jgi:hypothetical protein
VTLGKSVQNIQNGAFANCPALEEIYCKAKTPPTCYTAYNNLYAKTLDVFYDSYMEYITLHVPESSIETYKASEPWSKFKAIFPIILPEHTLTYMVDGEVYKTYSIEEDEVIIPEPEPIREGVSFSGWSEIPETMPAHDVTVTGTFVAVPKCATPTIKYEKGQLSFTCDTEGAEFVTEIADSDIKRHYDANIQLTATYTISVYATKAGYENSETASATLCWIDKEPSTEGITDGVAQIPSKAVLIQSEGGILKVEGVDDGTQIAVYTPDGKQAGSAVCSNGAALVGTNIQPGNTAIVKIGEKSVKVIVK